MYNIRVDGEKDLYIRLPKKMSKIELSRLTLDLSKKLEGKTLKVVVLDSNDESIPFKRRAIRQTTEDAELDYFGTNYYWEPIRATTSTVKGHPECKFPCDPDCKAVTCPVLQGFEEEKPDEYYYSLKMIEDDD